MSDPVLPGEGPMTDEALAAIGHRADTHIGSDHYRYTVDGIGYDGHWAHDTRRLIAEVKRLRSQRDQAFAAGRSVVKERDAAIADLAARDRTVEALSARLTAKNAELDKVIREAAADKARVSAENARYLQIISGITADNAGLTSCLDAVQAEAHKMLAEHGQSWNSISGRRILNVFDAAPEMPRPPAEEADAEYMVVIPSLCGNPTDYRMSYSSDRVRKSTREAAIAHGLEVEGHDDWLIAIVVGDKLTGLAWQHEDRDDAEEVEEAAAALGLTAAFAMPIPAAQEPASGPETAGTGSGRGTGVTEAQASDG